MRDQFRTYARGGARVTIWVNARMARDLVIRLDEWRAAQTREPSRGEAVRHFAELGLAGQDADEGGAAELRSDMPVMASGAAGGYPASTAHKKPSRKARPMRKKLVRSRAFGEIRPPGADGAHFIQDGALFDAKDHEILAKDSDERQVEPRFEPGEPVDWSQHWQTIRKEIEMRTGIKPENKLHAEELAKTACLFE